MANKTKSQLFEQRALQEAANKKAEDLRLAKLVYQQILEYKASIIAWIVGPPYTIPVRMSVKDQIALIKGYRRKNMSDILDTHDYYEFIDFCNQKLISIERATGENGIIAFLSEFK